MRRFRLVRTEDVSGSSGTGTVAEGVEFTDGRVALRWRVAPCSSAAYDSLEDVLTIHGHEGRTRTVFLDPPVLAAPLDPAVGVVRDIEFRLLSVFPAHLPYTGPVAALDWLIAQHQADIVPAC